MKAEQLAEHVSGMIRSHMEAFAKQHEQIADVVIALDDRLKSIEDRQPQNGADGKDGLPGKDGKDASDEQVAKAVSAYLGANPPERGEKGADGRDGADGKDADPIDMQDVVRELALAPEIKALVDLLVAEGIAEYFKANPVQHGKDGKPGADGKDGEPGEKGEKGDPGADGVGIAGAMIDRDGVLIVTTSKGEAIRLGVVNGRDGIDGKSFDSFDMEYLPETHEIAIKATVGERTKELRYPAGGISAGGYWSDGVKARAGQAWTNDGSLWIAKRDTSSEPKHGSDDWFMAARQGRQGEAGRPGKDYVPPQPVKLNT